MAMNLKQYAELVNKMRQAQKEYFRARSTQALTLARCLERKVDQANAEVLSDENQGTLFSDE